MLLLPKELTSISLPGLNLDPPNTSSIYSSSPDSQGLVWLLLASHQRVHGWVKQIKVSKYSSIWVVSIKLFKGKVSLGSCSKWVLIPKKLHEVQLEESNHGSYVNTKEPWFYKETLVKIGWRTWRMGLKLINKEKEKMTLNKVQMNQEKASKGIPKKPSKKGGPSPMGSPWKKNGDKAPSFLGRKVRTKFPW